MYTKSTRFVAGMLCLIVSTRVTAGELLDGVESIVSTGETSKSSSEGAQAGGDSTVIAHPASLCEPCKTLEQKILHTYLVAAAKRKSDFCAIDHMHMETEKMGKGLIRLETTIYGNRDEFVNPEDSLVSLEKETLRGELLLAVAQKAVGGTSVIKLGEQTKCYAPVYYDGPRGWMRCATIVPQETLDAQKAAMSLGDN